MNKPKILVTGGAGFIGSHLIRLWLQTDPGVFIVNFDKLTYSGDLSRLKDVTSHPRYRFVQGDICDTAQVERAMEGCAYVVHLAAETHVDRSLLDGKRFFDTNTYGTYVLLESARKKNIQKFLLVSTDEVYGSRAKGYFKEKDALNPSSPYSVSKTAADLLAMSYVHTYGMNVVVTRGSNTFGPFQYPEKVIPLFVSNALSNLPLPLYGDGLQIRNWMHAEDHARGIIQVLKQGRSGEAYNISTPFYLTNIDLTRRILKILGKSASLIKKVRDRVGHDRRYAIDPAKIEKLGWKPERLFDESLRETVLWYKENRAWWETIKDKKDDFKAYYAKAYQGRV